MYILNSMRIRANKDEVLTTLRKNRENHKRVVGEARIGYVEKAKAALEKKMRLVADGKIVSLAFALKAPVDYTAVYDTAIRMLEMHTGKEVDLDAGQVHNLVEDNWDWTHEFLVSNSAYSASARDRLGAVDLDSE